MAAIGWWALGRLGPPPPLPTNLEQLDAEVAQLIEQVANAVGSSRRNAERRATLGMVYQANGLQDLALICYQQALDLDDDDPRSWYRLAVIHDRLGDVDQAIIAMQRVIRLDDTYAPAYWRLGFWLLDTGESQQAQDAFFRATKLRPSQRAPWFGLARVHLARHDHDAARKIIEDHLLIGPNAPYANQLMAIAHRQAGRLDEAERAARTTAPGQLKWPDAWADEVWKYQTGLVALRRKAERLMVQQRYGEALQVLDGHRIEESGDPLLLNLLAAAYTETGQRHKALTLLRKAVQANPESGASHQNLASAYQYGRSASITDLQQALKHINLAIKLAPHRTEAWRLKAMILGRSGRPREAAEVLKSAFRLDSRDVSTLVEAGFIECGLRDWKSALSTFQEAADRDALSGDALFGVAIAQMEQGELELAQAALDRATELGTSYGRRLTATAARLRSLLETRPTPPQEDR